MLQLSDGSRQLGDRELLRGQVAELRVGIPLFVVILSQLDVDDLHMFSTVYIRTRKALCWRMAVDRARDATRSSIRKTSWPCMSHPWPVASFTVTFQCNAQVYWVYYRGSKAHQSAPLTCRRKCLGWKLLRVVPVFSTLRSWKLHYVKGFLCSVTYRLLQSAEQ